METQQSIKKKGWKLLILIFKGIYHYIDLITDIILVLLFKEKSETSESPALKSQFQLMLYVMLVLLIWERISTYNFFIEYLEIKGKKSGSQGTISKQDSEYNEQRLQKIMQNYIVGDQKMTSFAQNVKQSDDLKNNIDFNNNSFLKSKCMVFIVVITFMDYFYIILMNKNSKNKEEANTFIQIMKKDLIQLYAENIAFSALSTFMLFREFVDGKESLDIKVILAMASSVLSVSHITYKSYVARHKMQNIVKTKNEISFKNLSLSSKIFVCDPFKVNLVKMFSEKLYLCKDLMVEQSRRIYHKQKDLLTREKIFILIYVSFQQSMFCMIVAFSKITVYGVNPIKGLITGALLMLIQVIVYSRYKLQDCKTWGQRFCVIFKILIGWPAYGIQGCVIFYLKMFTESLPFISKIKEAWPTNFYPSWFQYTFKHLFAGYQCVIFYHLLYDGDFEEDGWLIDKAQISSPKELQNLQKKDGGFYYMTNYIIICWITSLVIDLTYFATKIFKRYHKKMVTEATQTVNNPYNIEKEVEVKVLNGQQQIQQESKNFKLQGGNQKQKNKLLEFSVQSIPNSQNIGKEIYFQAMQDQVPVKDQQQNINGDFDTKRFKINDEEVDKSGTIDQSHIPHNFTHHEVSLNLSTTNQGSFLLPPNDLDHCHDHLPNQPSNDPDESRSPQTSFLSSTSQFQFGASSQPKGKRNSFTKNQNLWSNNSAQLDLISKKRNSQLSPINTGDPKKRKLFLNNLKRFQTTHIH